MVEYKLDGVRSTMKRLAPLDLSQCVTINDIVTAMSHCSFGARMLGEAADTLMRWTDAEQRPLVVYDGDYDSALGHLLRAYREEGWFSDVMTSHEFAQHVTDPRPRVLVVGTYMERHETALKSQAEELIFINSQGQRPMGAVHDGYYPNVVFTDSRFVMPLLMSVLQERRCDRRDTVSNLIHGTFRDYGGVAAEITSGAQTLYSMIRDPRCAVFMTISGAMTIAQMSLVLCDMIDRGMVHYIASTGALMAHGLVEGLGLAHYKYDPRHSDQELATEKINRVTDTLEPEENLDHVELVLGRVLASYDGCVPLNAIELHRRLGEHLRAHFPDSRSILKSAYDRGVPVNVTAFWDSEIANDLFIENAKRRKAGTTPIVMDLERDTQQLFDIALAAEKRGLFTVGGGVPRNNTQNIAPLSEIYRERVDRAITPVLFDAGCRIDPMAAHFGSLGGCTYSEGMSWRKMRPEGEFSEIHCDATIAWPLLVKYVMERMEKEA